MNTSKTSILEKKTNTSKERITPFKMYFFKKELTLPKNSILERINISKERIKPSKTSLSESTVLNLKGICLNVFSGKYGNK